MPLALADIHQCIHLPHAAHGVLTDTGYAQLLLLLFTAVIVALAGKLEAVTLNLHDRDSSSGRSRIGQYR